MVNIINTEEMTTFRVYLDIAVYDETIINDVSEDEDYDLIDYRFEKFNQNLVTNEQAPHIVNKIIKELNWNTNETEHITKFAYISNGKFVAEIKILDYVSNPITDKDELYNYMLYQLQWRDEMESLHILINGKYYEVDMEIDDVYKLSSHGEELEFDEEDEDDEEEEEEDDEDNDDDDDEDNDDDGCEEEKEEEILRTNYNESDVKEEIMSLAYKESAIEEEIYEE